MMASPLLQWALTALFAGTAAWSVARLVAARTGPAERISALCHLGMGAAMLAMVWVHLPVVPQVVAFAIAALWFAVRALVGPRWRDEFQHPRIAHLHHAATMGAMVWMAATMPVLMRASSGGGHQHHHAAGAQVALAPEAAAVPAAITAVTAVLAGYFVLSCLPWLSTAFDLGRTLPAPTGPAGRRALDHACHGAMSFGMGAAFLGLL
ncbi:DUF5134 domain-containing protein [Saccharopolyspora cebuensis]|uniref:DUF5134 domain-containing protein n=1 Tax=Saccharopolyspora cebuensis TaxID=418759 RepID=A0ABV4CHS3_9PSEU